MKLLDQVRQKLRAGYYADRTEQSHVRWIEKFIRWHADIHRGWRRPAEMGDVEIARQVVLLARRSLLSRKITTPAGLLTFFANAKDGRSKSTGK